jgi:hypothetical protein
MSDTIIGLAIAYKLYVETNFNKLVIGPFNI